MNRSSICSLKTFRLNCFIIKWFAHPYCLCHQSVCYFRDHGKRALPLVESWYYKYLATIRQSCAATRRYVLFVFHVWKLVHSYHDCIMITHVDDSRRARIFIGVCLSVYLIFLHYMFVCLFNCTISQPPLGSSNSALQPWVLVSGKPRYFGVKGQDHESLKNSVSMGRCTLVSAGFFQLAYSF